MLEDGLCLRASHDGGEGGGIGVFDRLQRTEMLQQAARGAFPNAGNFLQLVLRSRIWRRLRWKVTAKRCASSRIT